MAEAEAEGQAQGREASSAARIARDAAVAQAAGTLAYLGVCVLVSVAILKRDELARLWRRLTARRPDPGEVPPEVLAEFRREVSRLEHGAAS